MWLDGDDIVGEQGGCGGRALRAERQSDGHQACEEQEFCGQQTWFRHDRSGPLVKPRTRYTVTALFRGELWLVCRGFFDVIDGQHIDGCLFGSELEPKLLLEC